MSKNMTRSVCFYFQIHQPFRLRTYRFFDMGVNHYYYDDFLNRSIARRIAQNCYLPANNILLELIKELQGRFKVAFSISGLAIEQFEMYAPEVIDSFKALAATGQVEFLAETYAHSLASLRSKKEFERQVRKHEQKIEELFGEKPVTLRNTELIYSDEIAGMVYEMGYRTMLTEGAKHVLGWKSPNFLYHANGYPDLKLLLKNFTLSDDIAFRFSNRDWSEWPLTAEKFTDWLKAIKKDEPIVNIFIDYETFGEHHWADTGIFDFLKALPRFILAGGMQFVTPAEAAEMYEPVAPVEVPYPISWADAERDLTAWLGNEMQDEAFEKLYGVEHAMAQCDDEELLRDWYRLQASDHFYYMCTKWFTDGDVHRYFNPYPSPYEAFINYMNVLSDFQSRVETWQSRKKESEVHANEDENEEAKNIRAQKRLLELTVEELLQLPVLRVRKVLNGLGHIQINNILGNIPETLRNRVLPGMTKKMRKEYYDSASQTGSLSGSQMGQLVDNLKKELDKHR
ncbi:MAG: glycoside hydrolase family 57 protein [Bacteroidales bacterium]